MAEPATPPTGEVQTQPAAPTTQFVGSATGQPLAPSAGVPAEGAGGVLPRQTEGEPQAPTGQESSTETGDDKPVVGHGGKEMSPEAISARVERANKKLLRELLGTDDLDEAKKLVSKAKASGNFTEEDAKQYEILKRKEAARARARLTEEQRAKADLEAKDSEIAKLKAELEENRTSEVVRTQDEAINAAALAHVDKRYMKYARRDLAEYLRGLQEEDSQKFAKFGQKQLERWFQRYSTENPAFAVKPADKESQMTPRTPTLPKPTVQRNVTTTRTAARPPAAPAAPDGPGMWKGKTVKPGQPNSMTKQELREYARAHGVRLNY